MDWTWFAISYAGGVTFGAVAVAPFFWMLSGLRQREREVRAYARGYDHGWDRAEAQRPQWTPVLSNMQVWYEGPACAHEESEVGDD